MIALNNIESLIENDKGLPLNEKLLGSQLLNRVSRLLNKKQSDLRLSNCTLKSDESHVSLSGQLAGIFGFGDITTEFILFEHPPSRTGGVRHGVFSIEIQGPANPYSYLGQYIGEPDRDSPPGWTAATSMLGRYFNSIAFEGKKMLFSSIDYTQRENEDAFYPEVYREPFPVSRVRAGINFPVKVAYSKEVAGFFADVFDKDKTFEALLETESPSQAVVVVTPGSPGVSVVIYRGAGVELGFNPISISLEGIVLSLPLVAAEKSEPQIGFSGSLKLKEEHLKITTEFNPYYHDLAISFQEFPSLKDVIGLLGSATEDAYFPEPLSSLLSVRLSRLDLAVSLVEKSVQSVRAISLSLRAEKAIPLIENAISFKPELDLRIDLPFSERYRAVEGELRGVWQLGQTAFKTALYYPSFNFEAGMMPDQSLDLLEVVKALLSAIDLPKPETRVPVTRMEVSGNFLDKSFSAEIDADWEWQFSLGGRHFALRIDKLLVTYANQSVGCALDGTFELAGVHVFVSAGYHADQGLVLSGGIPVGENVDFTSIANDLLESLSLPAGLPKLKLTNIIFAAAPKKGEYSLGCEAVEEWELMRGISLKVDKFRAEKKQGLSVTGLLRVRMTIADTDLWLSAEKTAAASGGWKFEGSSAEGKKIEIRKIVGWVGDTFGGKPQLPEAIKSFTVDKLRLSFESESKDFFFTCEGEVKLSGEPVRGIVTIDIKHGKGQDKSDYTKRFGGSLTIDGMEFDLIFESSHKAADGDSSTLFAAYHDSKGHTVKIDDVVNRILTDRVTTGLEISLKDALFAYQKKKDTPEKYLFGLDIEGGLNLSELNLPSLPLIGQPFPAGETLKLALQVLAAGDTFTVEEIDGLNNLTGTGLSLPQHQKLDKGLKLAALLRVAQETKPLSLPIGLGQGNGQGTGLVQTVPDTTTNQPADYPRSDDGTQWISVQKTFGPIHVERVGIGYQNGYIAVSLDAALTVAGLTLSLDGLGAEFALKDLMNKTFKPTFHLNGLGIDYRSGPVEIGGSFLQQKMTQEVDGVKVDYTSYAGLAVIRTKKLTLSAIGSYAQINGRDPSLFIYAVANYPLGGPAFFYVTGFAAGFGYNRALNLPPIDEIANFPLIAEAVRDGGPDSLPSGQKEQQKTLSTKLQQLERYLPPSVGDIFIAAGIKFTSFKQIDSFALLVVKFGRRFEIDLLGLSTLTAPPPDAAKAGTKAVAPIAEAQLMLKASFIPDEGFLGVRAQLTPNSYILSKDCHLNGGFAFYTWFEPHPNAGDFVLTLGGYHPKFIVPDHYPQVPRLALNWQVSPELHIKADAYFALTGSAIMAGGHLQATWESGDLRAWFVAGADFLLAWKPFHYDLELYVGMGVSYTFKSLGNQTLSVDLGANLHLWGPPFSGTATVHWSIISFTVNFGEGAPQHLEKLEWDTFKSSFLPKPEQICSIAVQEGLMRQMKAIAIEMPKLSDTMTEGTLVKWIKKVGKVVQVGDVLAEVETGKATMEMKALDEGVLSEIYVQDGQKLKIGQKLALLAERWIVNPKEMVLATHSAIPLNRVEGVKSPFSCGVEGVHLDRLVVQGKVSITDQLPMAYRQQIAAVQGVKDVTYASWFGGYYQDPKNNIFSFAVEASTYFGLFPEIKLPEDQLKTLIGTRTGAVIGRKLAEKYGWKIGDSIQVKSTMWTKSGGTSDWSFQVVGIFENPEDVGQEQRLFFNNNYFDEERILDKGMIGWYRVRIDDPAHAAAISSAIDRLFANSDRETKTVTEKEFQQSLARTIAPMGIESNLTSSCSITITRGDKPGEQVLEDTFQVQPIRKHMPAGLWGKPNLTDDKKYLKPPNLNGPQLVENLLAGFEIRPRKKDQKAPSCDINRDELEYTTTLVPHENGSQAFELPELRGQSAWNKAAETVIGTREKRDQLIRVLGLVNAEIDFGEPVGQGVLLAA